MFKIADIELDHVPLLLAPMEGVTDPPFRHACKEQGADIVYSEFISSDGLIRDAVKSVRKLGFVEGERPFGVQIFGNSVKTGKGIPSNSHLLAGLYQYLMSEQEQSA